MRPHFSGFFYTKLDTVNMGMPCRRDHALDRSEPMCSNNAFDCLATFDSVLAVFVQFVHPPGEL